MMLLGRYFAEDGTARSTVKSFDVPLEAQPDIDAARDAIQAGRFDAADKILRQRLDMVTAQALLVFIERHPDGVELVGEKPEASCTCKLPYCGVHGLACDACGTRHGAGRNDCPQPRPDPAHVWRAPRDGEAREESGICDECGLYASEAHLPCDPMRGDRPDFEDGV